MRNWWQYFALKENPAFRGTEQTRLMALVIFSLTTLIVTIQLVRTAIKIKEEEGASGDTTKRYYYMIIIGLYLILLNSFFIRLSSFLTDGVWITFSRETGILYTFGAFLYLIGVKNITFRLVDFTSTGKILVMVAYYLLILNSFINLFAQSVFILDLFNIGDFVLLFIFATGILSVVVLTTFIVTLIREMLTDPSKIEKVRLGLLAISLFALLVENFLIAIGSSLKTNGDPFFVSFSAYYLPIAYLVLHPLMFICYRWSLILPNWLLIKTGVIQPSFKEFLNKSGQEAAGS